MKSAKGAKTKSAKGAITKSAKYGKTKSAKGAKTKSAKGAKTKSAKKGKKFVTPSPSSKPSSKPSTKPSLKPSLSSSPSMQPSSYTPPDCNPLCAANQACFSVVLTTDNKPQETSWTLAIGNNIVLSRSSYPAANTRYVDQVCLPTGSTTFFTINDTGGDGICCANGNGSYFLFTPIKITGATGPPSFTNNYIL